MPIFLPDFFIPNIQHALDDRENKPDIAARDAIPTIQRFPGLETFVVSGAGGGGEKYILQDGVTNADWVLLGSGGGTIGGSIAAGQVAYGSATDTIQGNSNFTRNDDTGLVYSRDGFNVTSGLAVQRYVNAATGNDSNDGLNPLTPWLTIQHAIDSVPAFISGPYIINIADGTYSEVLTAPAYFAGRSTQFGGAVMQFIGNTTTPADVILSASGSNIFENSAFAQNNPATYVFDGIRFVGDNNNAAVATVDGFVVFGAVEFIQLATPVEAQFTAKIIFQPNDLPVIMTGITSEAFNLEDGALLYLANSLTGTNFSGRYISLNTSCSVLHDENQVISVTTVSSPTPSANPAFVIRGEFGTGTQNQFIFDGFGSCINLAGEGKWIGGQDNQFDFANCASIANIQENSTFVTSFDGSSTYTTSGGTPSTQNFFIIDQATLENELNSGSGSPEIPYVWIRGADDLETNGLWLGNDWRFKGSQTIVMPGIPTPSSGGWISPLGLADFAYPLYTARKNEIFSFVRIKTSNANGPNGGSVTDSYTVYVNGVATTMAGVIIDDDFVNISVNPQILEPYDEVAVFALFASNTLVEDVRVVI
jgi:hypothetical protein